MRNAPHSTNHAKATCHMSGLKSQPITFILIPKDTYEMFDILTQCHFGDLPFLYLPVVTTGDIRDDKLQAERIESEVQWEVGSTP